MAFVRFVGKVDVEVTCLCRRRRHAGRRDGKRVAAEFHSEAVFCYRSAASQHYSRNKRTHKIGLSPTFEKIDKFERGAIDCGLGQARVHLADLDKCQLSQRRSYIMCCLHPSISMLHAAHHSGHDPSAWLSLLSSS